MCGHAHRFYPRTANAFERHAATSQVPVADGEGRKAVDSWAPQTNCMQVGSSSVRFNPARHDSSGRDTLRSRPCFDGIAFGSAVLCAAGGVGGDVVDVFDLDRRCALVVVADISGSGSKAAAQTEFIRYTIRTLAIESDGDPAVILAKFNAIYCRTIEDSEAFVVLIIGIVDSRTGRVCYASAGHEPAFVRRGNAVTLLEPTGPIVGISPYSAYRTATVELRAGDVLIWTTDGLTESRNAQGELLGASGLADWIATGPPAADALAEHLVAGLHDRSGDRAGDDVAVLAIVCAPVPALPLQRDRSALERALLGQFDDPDNVARLRCADRNRRVRDDRRGHIGVEVGVGAR